MMFKTTQNVLLMKILSIKDLSDIMYTFAKAAVICKIGFALRGVIYL